MNILKIQNLWKNLRYLLMHIFLHKKSKRAPFFLAVINDKIF